jgi:hypothetical protein
LDECSALASINTTIGDTMAELYWAWQQYEMSPPAQDIGDVYGALAQAMQQQGWQGVQHQQDVHGYKPGIDLFAAVVFLHIAGTTFWQVIAVGGGTATEQQAQQELAQLQSLIAHLEFL